MKRRRSDKDERNLIVSVTRQGEMLGERAAAVPEEIVRGAGLEREEAVALYGLLQKMLDRLNPTRE